MSLRTFIVTSFLVISGIINVCAQRRQLLHQSFAAGYLLVDSIRNSYAKPDSAKAFRQLDSLVHWAEDNNDKPLAYAFTLAMYSRLLDWRGVPTGKKIMESDLPALIKLLEQNNLPELQSQALVLLSRYYWDYARRYDLGFEAAMEAYDIYSKFSSAQFPLKYTCLCSYASCYYRFKDYPDALHFFLMAKNTETNSRHPGMADLLNTIGLCYRHSGMYDSAAYYFTEGLAAAKRTGENAWITINGGNLGITYSLEKKYKEAIPLLQQDIDSGLAHNKLNNNSANSIAVLGDVYLEMGEKKKGLETLLRAYNMVVQGRKWDNYELQQTICSRLAKAYALNGDYRMAYNFADSTTRVSDSNAVEKNALILSAVQQKINNEKRTADMQKRDREIKIQRLVWAFLLVSITLLIAVIFFVLRNYRNQKKTNELLSREKKRSEDLLLNILPAEVADELKDKGTAEARYFDHVTVMFTDFVNFTQASEKMNPQELIDELHACFKAFDEIISKHNIEKIKTIGDAYLAVAGLPAADPHHAGHIVSAAIEINEFMRLRREKIGDRTFTIRIGIHSGSVVAGIVGVIKFAYDIWGDAVNIAARMEQSSEAGKINISESTYELVKHKFRCTPRGQISAKNKGELNMYFVEGPI